MCSRETLGLFIPILLIITNLPAHALHLFVHLCLSLLLLSIFYIRLFSKVLYFIYATLSLYLCTSHSLAVCSITLSEGFPLFHPFLLFLSFVSETLWHSFPSRDDDGFGRSVFGEGNFDMQLSDNITVAPKNLRNTPQGLNEHQLWRCKYLEGHHGIKTPIL